MMGGGSGTASVVHAWRALRSGRRAVARGARFIVEEVPFIVMSWTVIGGLGWRCPSTYPVKASASFCSLLMLCVPTHSVGSYRCWPSGEGSLPLVQTSHTD